jgi:hypothetical protein
MQRFTAYGEVIPTRGGDLGVRVENEADIRDFWKQHQIDTDLDWFGPGAPVISIGRKEDIASCRIGDRVSITVQVRRGIKTVDFSVIGGKP